jgi:hypothetical protein
MIESELEAYFTLIGIKGSEEGDSYDYLIGTKILSTFNYKGIFWAIDDKSNKSFDTLGEIKDFYKLPLIPDNVKTKEELDEFYKVIGLKHESKP